MILKDRTRELNNPATKNKKRTYWIKSLSPEGGGTFCFPPPCEGEALSYYFPLPLREKAGVRVNNEFQGRRSNNMRASV